MHKFINALTRRASSSFLMAIFLASAVVGCGSVGGGGSSSDNDDSTTTNNNIAFTSVTNNTLSILGAGGDTETVLTYTVTDDSNSPISGIEVSFLINDSSNTNSAISATSPISNAEGLVTVTVQSSNNTGNITVSATIVGSSTTATSPQITIIGLTPDQITFLSTSSFTLDFLGSGNTDQAILNFSVTNTNSAPVSGALVNFTVNDPQNTGATLVSSSATSDGGGIAVATVDSGNSDGEFTITATINSSTISDTSPSITVTDLATDQITFISTTTDTLAFQDSGGIDQATLLFNLSNQAGDPLQGVNVVFSVNDPGGTSIGLANTTATSNSNGDVTTVVQSGTVPGVFSVVATVNSSTTITSSPIIVTAGLPVQNRFSISATPLNIANAHDTDGITADIQVIVSDALGNPIPDGTQIRFVTQESGSIDPSCTTAGNGRCSVTWTSSAPRPSSRRFTVLAYVNGIENFTDNNGNGVFDSGIDTFNLSDDTGEPFSDNDENDAYDLGEFFFDSNNDSIRTGPDGDWTTDGIVVYDYIYLALSDDNSTIVAANPAIGTTINLAGNSSQDVRVLLSDSIGNPLPIGTTVRFTLSNGRFLGNSTFTVPSTSTQFNATVIVEGDDTSSSGTLLLEVTTPDGTSIVPQRWDIDD